MDLPDDSQWDETTCKLSACPHPQCWATIRRIEGGHPRILGSPCKTPLDANDKLPVLTIVNMSDSCFLTKKRAPRHLSGFTFAKPHSLVSQRSKFDSRFQGRPRMDLPDKGLIKHTHRPPQVPVLNLNDTQLPCPQDVRNKVVIWIPGEPKKLVSPADKKYIIPSQDEKEKRKTSIVKDKPPLVLSGTQSTETQLTPPGIRIPPSSPVPWFEQLSSEFIPLWNQFDMLPKDLLKDLLSDAGKTMPYPEMKTQLATMKKKPPLAQSRPDSAISAHMFLSVHRLTLQRPALRHPEHLRKLCCNLKTADLRKQRQQQRKVKTPTKKQEVKKKSRSDPGSQSAKCLDAMVYDPCYGHRTLPGWKSDRKEQQEMKRKGPTLKQDATETPQVDYAEDFLDSFPSPQLSKPEPTSKDIITQMEVMREAEERTPKDLSASSSRTSWSHELKLLRILEAIDFEDEESQSSGMHSTESLEA